MSDIPDSYRDRAARDDKHEDTQNAVTQNPDEDFVSSDSFESACSSNNSHNESPSLGDDIHAAKYPLKTLGFSETDAKPSRRNSSESDESPQENVEDEEQTATTDTRVIKSTSKSIRFRRQSAVEPTSPVLEAVSPVKDKHAEEYNMTFPRRGVALVLNHMKFETEDYRKGSEIDCKRLEKLLKSLGFEVRIFKNLLYDDLFKILRQLSQEDHSAADCLLVAVMTHGLQGELYAKDHTYPVERLWSFFTADKCVSLAGKPKIFIIQACRGQKVDSGTVVADTVDGATGTTRYTIPNQADIIIANSTAEGFYAWRNPHEGSWFINALCQEIEMHGETRDLATILTFVSRRVAIDYESMVPDSPSMHQKKQIPCVVSMLTRLIYLRKKR